MNLKTDLTPEQVKNLTPEQYRAEVNRLMAAEIADWRRERNAHRPAGITLARSEGTGDADHDCSNC